MTVVAPMTPANLFRVSMVNCCINLSFSDKFKTSGVNNILENYLISFPLASANFPVNSTKPLTSDLLLSYILYLRQPIKSCSPLQLILFPLDFNKLSSSSRPSFLMFQDFSFSFFIIFSRSFEISALGKESIGLPPPLGSSLTSLDASPEKLILHYYSLCFITVTLSNSDYRVFNMFDGTSLRRLFNSGPQQEYITLNNSVPSFLILAFVFYTISFENAMSSLNGICLILHKSINLIIYLHKFPIILGLVIFFVSFYTRFINIFTTCFGVTFYTTFSNICEIDS